MIAAVFLTPLMLAAEPVVIKTPFASYDHRTQTSASARKLNVRMTYTKTTKYNGNQDPDSDTAGD